MQAVIPYGLLLFFIQAFYPADNIYGDPSAAYDVQGKGSIDYIFNDDFHVSSYMSCSGAKAPLGSLFLVAMCTINSTRQLAAIPMRFAGIPNGS